MSKFYTYEFTVRLVGGGETPEDAWNNLMDDGMLGYTDDQSIPEPADIKVIGEEEQEK